MREIFSIVLVIIGALIGAGFASGQEIYSFFYSYGVIGLMGIIITCSLIAITIYKSLKIIYQNKINNYDEFLKIFIKNEKVTKAVNIVLNILLLVTFYIMIAGFGAYFEQEIGINRILGSALLAVMTAIVFFTSVKGVLRVSEYIVPVLILFIIVIGGMNLISIQSEVELSTIKKGWLLSSVSYCSYNMILLIPVLISLRKQITKERNIKYIAIISGILMIIMSIMIYMLLIKSDVEISTLEMPIVYIIRTFFTKFKAIYAFIILSSIFTTAISIGIGFLQNISKNKKSYTQFVIFMCITSLIISKFGFSKLVNFVYPLFGYLGIIQIILIIRKKTYCKKRVL
ncbi:MAG: hypothetical protein IJE68_03130 [Clostridia bacterium]|nr:hypothetical protein [Clostridia bacterium]